MGGVYYLNIHLVQGNEKKFFPIERNSGDAKVWAESLDIILENSIHSAQAILLENHKEGSYGGTGESFNWNILKDIENDDQNFVLSGGINSQNVDNALKTNSWCLDLNSGVESQEGIKNIELVKDILKTIETYGI